MRYLATEHDRLTVADVMLTMPKVHGPQTTVQEIRGLFEDDHVHAALIVDAHGRLLSVLERPDLASTASPAQLAVEFGQLAPRIVHADTKLGQVYRHMLASVRRRLAVIDRDGRLIGLLCLKRDRSGFCSDQDVTSRAEEHGRALPLRLPGGIPPAV